MISHQPQLAARFMAQRHACLAESYPTLSVRLARLARLLAMTAAYETAITEAIERDFGGRSKHETRLAELFIVRAAIRHAQKHLHQWMKTQRVATEFHFLPGQNRLLSQPLGVVGIVSPWNYPFQLALGPAIAALAAGNRVLIKPSELTPHVSSLLAKMVAEYFDADELSVVTGDVAVARAFVELPFDHLLFTGSTSVGRQVALAAAKNLTPVTLELGGKSPAIFDVSCDLPSSARKLAYGKLLNAGQTCIAPDYLMVAQGQAEQAARAIAQAVSELYPSLAFNPDYSALISAHHHGRLTQLVDEARQAGAQIMVCNPAQESLPAGTKKFLPTLVINPPASTRLMQEEIFGPILPIIEYADLQQAIDIIKGAPRPLALYWFGTERRNRARILRETHAGGVTINDCLWHLAQENQPFGGVGASGMGAYHGIWGYHTFSKLKPVFYQSRWSGTRLFHPPYGKRFEYLLGLLKHLS